MAIDYTHADVAWSQVCVTRLAESLNAGEIGLEKPALSSETTCPLRWERPPSHWAVLLLADAVLNHDFDKELLQRDAGLRGLLEQALRWLATWILQIIREPSSENDASSPLMQAMAAQRGAMLYQRFYELRMRHIQGMLLQALLGNQVRSAIVLGVDLLVDCPPHSWQDSSLSISSLVQSEHWKVDDVYPRLLDSTDPAVLAPALDLANLLSQEKSVTPHPASERFENLLALLGGVVSRLGLLEEDPARFSQSVSEIQQILFDSVSLTVSLCHTMALLGDSRAIGKLNQAMDLRHRRIRAEAGFALAKLGESSAVDRLLELVEDDATRPRVLQYAEELGLGGRIRPEWQSDEARARSMLALHLSQPEWFAIAPQRIELVDRRELIIPGYQDPQACFLLRYEYDIGPHGIANIGFSGPCVYLFPTNNLDWDYDMIYELVLQSLEE